MADAVLSLLTGCSGAGWPTENLQVGMVAVNETTKQVGRWDGADWRAEGPRHVDASAFEWNVDLGTLSASVTKWLPVPLTGVEILSIAILSDTSTSSDGSNKWTFQVRNRTASENLFATAPTTNGAELTANVASVRSCDQNNDDIAAGSALDLVITKTGSATSLTSAVVTVRGRRLGA